MKHFVRKTRQKLQKLEEGIAGKFYSVLAAFMNFIRPITYHHVDGETEERYEKRKHILHLVYWHIPMRFLGIAVPSVVLSLLTKLAAEEGLFKGHSTVKGLVISYALFQLVMYAVFYIILAFVCNRSRNTSKTLKQHRIYMAVAYGIYALLCVVMVFVLTRESYTWFFRIATIIAMIDARKKFANLFPFVLIFLVLTASVLFVEPFLAKVGAVVARFFVWLGDEIDVLFRTAKSDVVGDTKNNKHKKRKRRKR